MTKPSKSKLITEIERSLTPTDYLYSSTFTIDVMANLRSLPLKDVSTFSDLVLLFLSTMKTYLSEGRCYFVFDLYTDGPLVDCERIRREEKYPMIDDSTPIPKDMATLWPSSTNKLLLEKLLYKYLCEKIPLHHPVVIGQVVSDNEGWQSCIRDDSGLSKYLLFQPVTEEADLQIIVHVLDALKSGHYINVILSNDSDIIVHVLDVL